MPEVPKIVRVRLEALAAGKADHPDPDLLTAFSERSLSPAERAGVLEHLSRCAECREVLALALPASEAWQPGWQVSRRRLTWPVFRWVFASAGIASLALFGFIEYGHRSQGVRMAQNTPAPSQYESERVSPAAHGESKANAEQPQKPTTTTDSVNAMTETRNRPSAGKTELGKALSPPAAHGYVAHGPQQMSQSQQFDKARSSAHGILNAPENKPSVSPPAEVASGASQMVDVQSQSALAELQSQAGDSLRHTANYGVSGNASDTEVSRAKSASASPALAQAAPAPLPVTARPVGTARIAISIWSVNAGRLQRSFDHGLTWQDVNVTGNPETEAGLELAVASSKAAKESARKDKKVSASPVFRAVAANGSDVWVGGTAAALYHSTDAGAHWVRVIPSSPSTTLTGDIVSLDFADPQNGRIATSNGEVWTTTDNGQSWQKQ